MGVTPERGGEPRIIRISDKLLAMLNMFPKNSIKVFERKLESFSRNFQKQRKCIAFKLQNQRILKITFHTLRHWRATMEYYKTKDILHVMRMFGHKNVNNTLIYTHLVNFEQDDLYICRVARTVEEASSLIETGFECVCEIDGNKLFMKRK